ncbi:DUF6216 family protein [Pseudomonas sp. S2_B03]
MPTAIIENNLDWITKNLTLILTLSNFLLIITFFIYIYKRARSFLFARDKIWRLFGGKPSFSNPRFEKLKNDLRELEHFKFEFNIPATTLEEAELAEKWIHSNNLLISDISLARPHIDWTNFSKIKIKPRKFRLSEIFTSALLIFFVSLMALCISLTTSKYLFISFPDTPTFYATPDKYIFSIFSDHELNLETCKNIDHSHQFIDMDKFPQERILDLCESLKNPTETDRIKKELKQQKATLALLGFYFLIISIVLARIISKLSAAKRIYQRLNRLKTETGAA